MWGVFLLFLLFQGIIEHQFPMIPLYSYWDEFLTLLCLALWIFRFLIRERGIKTESLRLAFPWLLVVPIGVLGNAAFHYAMNTQAIIRDAVGFLKFPLALFTFREMRWDVRIVRAFRRHGARILKIAVSIMFVSAIISLFHDIGMSNDDILHGVYSCQFLFNHPTVVVYASAASLCLLYADEPRKRNFVFQMMLVIVIILAMRTKGFAFLGVYFLIRHSSAFPKQLKPLYIPCAVLLVFAISFPKLSLYMSYSIGQQSGSPRETLWRGSFQLMRDCFPIGSGFASFASHISGKYRSRVYDFINMWQLWLEDGSPSPDLGDTGYPYYIAQFGFLGMLALFIGTLRILKLWGRRPRSSPRRRGKAEYLLILYIAISLTSESLLLNHGFELAVILAVIIRCDEMRRKSRTLLIGGN